MPARTSAKNKMDPGFRRDDGRGAEIDPGLRDRRGLRAGKKKRPEGRPFSARTGKQPAAANQPSRWATPARSSSSSASVLSIAARLNSSIGRPWMRVYSPLARGHRHAVHHALRECRSCRRTARPSSPTCRCCPAPSRGCGRWRRWRPKRPSDSPRASMIAAPRLATCGMNVLAFQSASLILSFSDCAVDGGEAVVGVHGRAVVAPHDQLLDVGRRPRRPCRPAATARGCGPDAASR